MDTKTIKEILKKLGMQVTAKGVSKKDIQNFFDGVPRQRINKVAERYYDYVDAKAAGDFDTAKAAILDSYNLMVSARHQIRLFKNLKESYTKLALLMATLLALAEFTDRLM